MMTDASDYWEHQQRQKMQQARGADESQLLPHMRGGAAAGGWSDVTTLIRCYQQADDDTLLRVMNEPRKVTEKAKSG